jgi:hypothetical protein
MVGGWRQRKRYLIGKRLERINKERFDDHTEDTRKRIGQRGTTAVPCSCYLCGNPRKHYGLSTRKEELQQVTFLEQVNELEAFV